MAANIVIQNQLVQWLNDAVMADGKKKVELLMKVQEVLIHQLPRMIPTLLDNILSYSADRSPDVKKQVITFIEEISKYHQPNLPKVVATLRVMLTDSVIAIQKRVIQAASIVYKNALVWICSCDGEYNDLQNVWEQLNALKLQILNMIDSENEGIRTNAIKFLEGVITLQTLDENGEGDFSLDNIPMGLDFLDRSILEDESEHIFSLLQKFHNSQHISSVNLMACMTALCNLAKVRPKFMSRVIQALSDLHTTLPPTLSNSQVNSVRKHLKMLLVNTVKHPSALEMMPQLSQLLSSVGMTVQEIAKIIPKEKKIKRLLELRNGDGNAKRARVDSPFGSSQSSGDTFPDDELKIIATEESVYEGINKLDNVINLVIETLKVVPDEMPDDFKNVYRPIPNAGSVIQKRKLAKMITSVIKGEPIVQQRDLSELTSKIPLIKEEETDERTTLKNALAKFSSEKNKSSMEAAVAKLREEKIREDALKEKGEPKEKPPPTPTVPKLKQKVKQLKLQEITKPIPQPIREKLLMQAVKRILNAENASVMGGVQNIRDKLIITFASTYSPEIREVVLDYILEDPKSRIELALMWLYDEFSYMQGFSRLPVSSTPKNQKHDYNYNNLLCALITQINDSDNPAVESCKESLLRRIYLEAPVVTEDAVNYLKHLVSENSRTVTALELLEEIIERRPTKASHYVPALLCHSVNQFEEIRVMALKSIVKIYNKYGDSVKRVIEKYAKLYLGFIPLARPPYDLFEAETGRMEVSDGWTDDLYKTCLGLAVAILPYNLHLIHEIAMIYGHSGPEAKRCILRAIEGPLRKKIACMTENQEPFLAVIEDCPRGADTFITRLVQIMTEKQAPSKELVQRVKSLYKKHVSDVRFLIPILNGLEKEEIIAALPKLIKLSSAIVREVFNKLLGVYNVNDEELPLSPVDLFVALHLIDTNTTDLKYIIKATGMCIADKINFNEDVILAAIHDLLEQPEVPVLFMRTLLQSLSLYPSISAVVIGILQKLITKQIWNSRVVWEGFLKCAERTKPGSYHVLLNLPPNAISQISEPMRGYLVSHLSHMTPQQRAIYPQATLQMLLGHQMGAPVAVPAPEEGYPSIAGVPPPEFDGHHEQWTDPNYGQPPHIARNPLEPLPPGMD